MDFIFTLSYFLIVLHHFRVLIASYFVFFRSSTSVIHVRRDGHNARGCRARRKEEACERTLSFGCRVRVPSRFFVQKTSGNMVSVARSNHRRYTGDYEICTGCSFKLSVFCLEARKTSESCISISLNYVAYSPCVVY